ncbi:hypothetical protein GGS20DRAFT_586560 [Poronia punctata]|nr:hypothetical protein GGS20DRAFT_586560 [Poronia punctata]
MAEEVERLVLAPFRDIVEKGKAAIENVESAGDQAPEAMLKAAQNLVKEGERALKKIEPISTANYEEYGSNFVDAIKENDEISEFRSELVDLVWDFDDYIEVAEFDAGKFEELQKASRRAAPRILDIIKRMKLVPPTPAPPISPPPSEGRPATSMATHTRPESMERLVMGDVEGRASDMIGTGAGPDTGLWGDAEGLRPPRGPLCRANPSEPPSEPPPTPPSANPWQVGKALTTNLGVHSQGDHLGPRPLEVVPDSPTIPQTQLISPSDSSSGATLHEEHEMRMRAASQSHASTSEGSLSPTMSQRWTNSTQGSAEWARPGLPHSHSGFGRPSLSHTLEDGTHALSPVHSHEYATGRIHRIKSPIVATSLPRPDGNPVVPRGHSPGAAHAIGTALPLRSTSVPNQSFSSYVLSSSRKPSAESINSSVFDVVEASSPMSPISPGYTGASGASGPSGHRQSVLSTTSGSSAYQPAHLPPRYPGPPPVYQVPPVPAPDRRTSGATVGTQSSVGPTAHARSAGARHDEGLIPVDMESSMGNGASLLKRDHDCSITPASSFYKMKGFCKGAEEAQRSHLGFKRIKRPIGGFSSTVVAKCTHCLFELDYKQVEQDLNNESTGNFTSNTVGFRLRVLQKSHLPIRIIEEQMYGCLFCINEGRTLEESDATVFFNQKQLFAHMARHPRPLPRVAGITVIEDVEPSPAQRDNFDLHFPHPPIESVMLGIAREVARLPAGIATETKKITAHSTMRLPPDRQPVLHFAIGARIVGIEFPAKYEGKWAIGWHDGVRAPLEADTVQIEAPSRSEVKMQATSSVQAVARWKWNQKGDDRWLKFDKGDVIKNISWVYEDHWCWSGTTSKGSGVFPQSHIDPDSVRVVDASDAASVTSWEKRNPLKFSLRG